MRYSTQFSISHVNLLTPWRKTHRNMDVLSVKKGVGDLVFSNNFIESKKNHF